MKMRIEERERACFELLARFPKEKYVLIGGYATSAFDFPRFSVDLDIVITEEDLEFFISLLERQGLTKTISKKLGRIYKGQFIRFAKRIGGLAVNVDLLVNMVQSRQTDSAYSFEYLFRNSEIREVTGSALDARAEARVADREMLIALKANSMRLADQRDIIALCNGDVDVEKVVEHLTRCPQSIIGRHIDMLLKTLRDPKTTDSIKGVFGLSDEMYHRLVARTERVFHEVRERLARGS